MTCSFVKELRGSEIINCCVTNQKDQLILLGHWDYNTKEKTTPDTCIANLATEIVNTINNIRTSEKSFITRMIFGNKTFFSKKIDDKEYFFLDKNFIFQIYQQQVPAIRYSSSRPEKITRETSSGIEEIIEDTPFGKTNQTIDIAIDTNVLASRKEQAATIARHTKLSFSFNIINQPIVEPEQFTKIAPRKLLLCGVIAITLFCSYYFKELLWSKFFRS